MPASVCAGIAFGETIKTMAQTLRKIRVAIVAGAVLLLIVIAGFLWYGRYSARRFWVQLPHKLGADIKQEANGFTYSQSLKGRTIFTVHAAREVQHNNGRVTLKDVSIVLYGNQPGTSDRIQGSEFEFDQAAGILTAVGDVDLDLDVPPGQGFKLPGAGASPERGTTGSADNRDARIVHVKTSGLTFNQKERTAVTPASIEFRAGGLAGRATGARYDAASGLLVLESAVEVSGERLLKGSAEPTVLHASHAEFTRATSVVSLERADFASEGQTLSAQHAQIHVNDGHPDKLAAQGSVRLAANGRGTLSGNRLEAELNADGRLRSAHVAGDVEYVGAPRGERSTHGRASDLHVGFNAAGRPLTATMNGAVRMEERDGALARTLAAERVDVTFVEAGKGHAQVRTASANGNPVLHWNGNDGGRTTESEIHSDRLEASFDLRNRVAAPSRLDGLGHTSFVRKSSDGSAYTSTGDTLALTFASASAPAAGSGFKSTPSSNARAANLALSTAIQRGNVRVVRLSPAGKTAQPAGSQRAASQTQKASADEAVYTATGDRVALKGAVQLDDAQGILLADSADFARAGDDAHADGNVRASYAQANGETMHLLAAHAVEHNAEKTADFTGDASKPARMWQAGSQIEAPALHFDRARRVVIARGMAAEQAPGVSPVHAVLTGARSSKAGPVRLAGRQITYDESLHQVHLEGGVRVEDRDGIMRAREATAYLAAPLDKSSQPADKPGASAQGTPFPAGQVEKVVARGAVVVEQPGRRATGEQLTYTAADGIFLLTGANGVQPRVVDDVRGTSTGASLRFRTGDDSVVISAGDDGSGTRHVRSETRAPESKTK